MVDRDLVQVAILHLYPGCKPGNICKIHSIELHASRDLLQESKQGTQTPELRQENARLKAMNDM